MTLGNVAAMAICDYALFSFPGTEPENVTSGHGRPFCHRRAFMGGTSRGVLALLLALGSAQPTLVHAQSVLPGGARVSSGSVTVSSAGTAMTVTQSTQRAIVNWDGFSVGQPNSVTFVQPNATSAILNRVTGATTSTIAGSITGNGQVYLVNPNSNTSKARKSIAPLYKHA